MSEKRGLSVIFTNYPTLVLLIFLLFFYLYFKDAYETSYNEKAIIVISSMDHPSTKAY